jgi:phosphatidate cytidylyltransferase
MTLLGKWAGIRLIDAVIISALAAITGTAGDLFESKLKRMAGVKDSGQIMPGHGGFLDRFDSLLFASVFAWIYLSLFTR